MQKIIDEMIKNGYNTTISIVWSAEDILGVDDTLTAEQVNDVLIYLKHKHDASIGINWDVIGYVIDLIKSKD